MNDNDNVKIMTYRTRTLTTQNAWRTMHNGRHIRITEDAWPTKNDGWRSRFHNYTIICFT